MRIDSARYRYASSSFATYLPSAGRIENEYAC